AWLRLPLNFMNFGGVAPCKHRYQLTPLRHWPRIGRLMGFCGMGLHRALMVPYRLGSSLCAANALDPHISARAQWASSLLLWRIGEVTLAVDNASALQVAAGFGQVSPAEFTDTFPWLWLIPACTMKDGRPVYAFRTRARENQPATVCTPPEPKPDSGKDHQKPQHLDLHMLTANVQTMKDAACSIFNPSGLAARRQYLYRQMLECQADVVCIQEARSKAGRWNGPGILTWRSGASKGQYGCEVWVRADVAQPALSLQDWRLIASTPRILCLTCVAPQLPLTVISAHAPHADRPDSEAQAFWHSLREVIRKCPSQRAIVIGLDANGDIHAADEDQALIGELLATSEPRRNDDCLLEFCLIAGFEVPGTFSSIQHGPGVLPVMKQSTSASPSGNTLRLTQLALGTLRRSMPRIRQPYLHELTDPPPIMAQGCLGCMEEATVRPDELEEQFRAQEGGLHVTEGQLQARMRRWADTEAAGCPAAMPSLLELEQICLRQKGGKAPGPDAIPNELWKLNPPKAGRWLWSLCTQIALSGREPSHFKKALQCALYKKGPASLPSNYRSIALLNGVAKIWHSHIRGTLGTAVINGYDALQLGGRKRIPVAFAVTTFRNVWELSVAQGFCCAALFVDIQAAYYETSRQLLFHGDESLAEPDEPRKRHLTALSHQLACNGALAEIGIQQDELDLLLDCVACSHWQMAGSSNIYIATRGSRPGDGLADVLFGALFSVALRHIRRQCQAEGITHTGAGQLIGNSGDVVPVGWADDLAVLADFESPAALQAMLPRMTEIVVSTLEHIRFRVNLGAGKTEVMVDIRGAQAKQARANLLTGNSALPLPDGREIRISPEYRHLGVIQQPRDNGRRDQELCRQRAQAAWAQARSLYASTAVPWELKQAWLAARILPAAYATLATNTALSRRATAPLEGFFERATRVLAQSWQYGHYLTKPSLLLLAALPSPEHASVVAKVRLVTLLCKQAPAAVWDIHEACWNRATPWSEHLVDSCRRVLPAIPQLTTEQHVTLYLLQRNTQAFVKACKHLSRFGSPYAAYWDLWSDVIVAFPLFVFRVL
ncbi:unnamed protein product, partial [Symbiodinium sp. CCMP2456]